MTRADMLGKLVGAGAPDGARGARSPKSGRRVWGAGGMGRHSMRRLGAKALVATTPEKYDGREFGPSDEDTHVLEIDWDAGTDPRGARHRLSAAPKRGGCGTVIEISGLRDEWGADGARGDLQRLARSLERLVLPDALLKGKRPFSVGLKAVGFSPDLPEPEGALLDRAAYKASASLRGGKMAVRAYRGGGRPGGLAYWGGESVEAGAACADADFTLYWFPGKIRDRLRDGHGVRIYLDGILMAPYGERGDDWLGLGARKAGPGGGFVRNGDLIGFVELSGRKNPGMAEAAERGALKESEAFGSLREGFVKAIEYLEGRVGGRAEADGEPGSAAEAEIGRALKALKGGGLDGGAAEALIPGLERAQRLVGEQARRHEAGRKTLEAEAEKYRNLAAVGVQALAFSHEILDPMRFVNLTLSNLRRLGGSMSEADRKTSVGQAQDRTAHALSWAVRMREFSGMLAGSQGAEPAPVAVLDSLLSIKEGMSAVLAPAAAELDIDVYPDVPDVAMNGASFESVFANLIGNSVRALKSVGGRQRRIRVSARKIRGGAAFRLEDNGCGIPERDREDVFRPFFTAHASAPDPGTGMGLAIVRDIVEGCGGAVRLAETIDEKESPGRGMAAFEVELPAGGQ